MSKFLTVVCLLICSSVFSAEQPVHVVTLELVESMLWHEGIIPSSENSQQARLSEELSVAVDILDGAL